METPQMTNGTHLLDKQAVDPGDGSVEYLGFCRLLGFGLQRYAVMSSSLQIHSHSPQ